MGAHNHQSKENKKKEKLEGQIKIKKSFWEGDRIKWEKRAKLNEESWEEEEEKKKMKCK